MLPNLVPCLISQQPYKTGIVISLHFTEEENERLKEHS